MSTDSATSSRQNRVRPGILAVAALVLAVAFAVTSTQSASALSSSISGWQDGDSTVYWGFKRTNTYAYNSMKAKFNGTNLGVPAFYAGARASSAPISSYAKTTGMYAGGTRDFKTVATGSLRIPQGSFYLTTSLGPAGCGCHESLYWTGTLWWNVAN